MIYCNKHQDVLQNSRRQVPEDGMYVKMPPESIDGKDRGQDVVESMLNYEGSTDKKHIQPYALIS